MLRTSTVLLRPTEEQESQLLSLLDHSARLWNTANYERRQAYFKRQRSPSYASQCNTLKTSEHFKALGTCKSQALLQKLSESWKSFRGLQRQLKRGELPSFITKVRPPRYWKDGGKCLFVRNDGWRMGDEAISISKSLKIKYSCGQLWVGKGGRLEIKYDRISNRWYAHIPVTVEEKTEIIQKPNRASVDLGVCNLVALAIEGVGKQIVWSGKQVLSDWQYWTKRIPHEQQRLHYINGRKKSDELSRLYRIRMRRFRHAVNAMLRQIFEVLETHEVGTLYIGDLNGIRENADYGDNANQKIHNFWSFDIIKKRILELGEEYSIKVELVNEANTSKTCYLCGETGGRILRGLYYCRTNRTSFNADANGALNILKVATNGTQSNPKFLSGSRLMAHPLLFKWDYSSWRSGT